MIVGIIFLVCNIMLILIMGAVTMGMNRPSRGKMFGIALPSGRENDDRVQEIVSRYIKHVRTWNILSLPTAFLVLIPTPYFSVLYSIFLIWTTAVIILRFRIIGIARRDLIDLKHQVGWYDPVRDEDEAYWIGGFIYSNPNSSKMFVNQNAFGYGSTVNVATKGGKRFMIVMAIVLFLSLIPTWGLIIWDDVMPPSVILHESELVVRSAMNKAVVSLEDIVSVELRKDLSIGTKVNGSGTQLYSRGTFYVGDLGKSHVFRFKDVESLIVVQQKNGIPLIFNMKTESETLDWYYKLTRK